MADHDRWREMRRGDEAQRDDCRSGDPRREPRVPQHEGRGYPFWGRGHRGTSFDRDERREYSREDYGASDRGPDYRGSCVREGRFGGHTTYGGSGYGGGDRRRTGYGQRESGSAAFSSARPTRFPLGSAIATPSGGVSRTTGAEGPKGYKRSDPRIQEDVNDRLADDPYLDASEIEVTVTNGEVTLSGTVDSRQARRRAEDIAEQLSGVTHVQDNVRVRSASGSSATYGAGSMAGDIAKARGDSSATAETAGRSNRSDQRFSGGSKRLGARGSSSAGYWVTVRVSENAKYSLAIFS